MDQLTAYRILKLSPGCGIEEIKEAYAALSKQYHPEEYPEQFQQIHEAYRFLMKMSRHSGRRQSRETVDEPDTKSSADSTGEADMESSVLDHYELLKKKNTGNEQDTENSSVLYDYETVVKQKDREEESEAGSSLRYDYESVIKRSVKNKEDEPEPTILYDFEAVLKGKSEGGNHSYQFDGALGQYEEYEEEENTPDINDVKRRLRKTINKGRKTERKKFRRNAGDAKLKKKKSQSDRNTGSAVKRKGRRSVFGGGVLVCFVLLRNCVRLNSSTGNVTWGVLAVLVAWILGLFILYFFLEKKFSNLVTQIWLSIILSVSNLFILGSETYADMIGVEAADGLSFLLFITGAIWFLVIVVIAICRGIRGIVEKKK